MHKTCIFTQQHPAGGQHDLWRLRTADISTRPAGPSCSCLRVGRVLRGHPYHAAALGAGRPGPGKNTCCLNTPWFSNRPPGTGIPCNLQHSANWFSALTSAPHLFSEQRFPTWTWSVSKSIYPLSSWNRQLCFHPSSQCSPWCIYFKASLLRGLPAGKWFYLTQRYHKLIYTS